MPLADGGSPATATGLVPPSAAPGARRSVPARVWLVVALFLGVMLCQTAIFPHARSPDERRHVDLVLQVRTGTAWPWPGPGQLTVTEGTRGGAFLPDDRIEGRQHLADRDDIPPRGDRQSYLDAGGTGHSGAEGPEPLNQLVQHPPLYYVLGAGVVSLIPQWETAPFDQVWMVLRWWNALLMAPLPLLLWAISRRLGLPDPLPFAAAMLPLAVPELTHLASAVNNDNLLIMLVAVATLFVVRVLTGDLSRVTAVGLGVVTSLALLTKGFALMIPVWVGLAYLVAGLRFRRPTALVSLLVAWAVSLPGIAWWVRNRVVNGLVQPHGTHTEPPELTAVFGWSDGGSAWLARLGDRLVTLYFVQDHAALMRQDASWWMSRVALGLIVVGVVVTLVRRNLPRADALVLLLPTLALAAIVAKGSWEQFAAYQNIRAGQQGRYLYSGMAALLPVALAGAARLTGIARRAVPLGVLVLAAAVHAAFQYDTWWLYWLPEDGSGLGAWGRAAQAVAHLYPFPTPVLVTIVVATAALAVTVVVVAVAVLRDRELRRRDA